MIPQQTFESYPVFGDTASKVKPEDAKYSAGFQQSDVLPAEWMNWAWNKNSKGITDLNEGVNVIEQELIAILTAAGITPSEATEGQINTAIGLLITAKTGTLTDLTTTAKTNLVAAVNELNAGKSPLAGSSSLTTCNQGTFGAAATHGVDTTVTSGSTNLPTSGAVNEALTNCAKKSWTILNSTTSVGDTINFSSLQAYSEILIFASNYYYTWTDIFDPTILNQQGTIYGYHEYQNLYQACSYSLTNTSLKFETCRLNNAEVTNGRIVIYGR